MRKKSVTNVTGKIVVYIRNIHRNLHMDKKRYTTQYKYTRYIKVKSKKIKQVPFVKKTHIKIC